MNAGGASEETQENKATYPRAVSTGKASESEYDLLDLGKSKAGASSSAAEAQSTTPDLEDDPLDSADQLDDYTSDAPGLEFPEIGPGLADRLRKDRLVFVYGTATNWEVLYELASYLVRTSFSDRCRPRAFYSAGPRTSVHRPSYMNTFDHLFDWVPENSKKDTLVVIFDDGPPEHSLLTRSKLNYDLGNRFLEALRKRSDLFLLVLTEEPRFEQFINRFHAYSLKNLYHAIEIPLPAKPPREMSRELLAKVEKDHKLNGLVSLWCMAWFDQTSLDDLTLCIRAVLEAQASSRRQRREIFDQWRAGWLNLLNTAEAKIVEDNRSVVYLKHSRSDLTAELRSVWRLEERLRHQGFVEDLRLSGLIQRAGPDLLESFTIFFAYRARLDPSWAPQIFFNLLEQWLVGADETRILFVRTSVFNALLFADQFDLATRALKYRPWRSHEHWTAAILFTAHDDFLKETSFITLYNQILPLITKDDTRSALWGRFLRVRAADEDQLRKTVEECSAHLTEHNFMAFTARFAEELLLSEGEVAPNDESDPAHRSYKGSLIHLIRFGAGESQSASGILCRTISSPAFKQYGEERTSYWSATEDDSQLLKVWVVRSLLPLIPELPIQWLLSILSTTVFSPRPIDRASKLGPPSGREQLVAMLLITCAARDDVPAEGEMLRRLCSSLITDMNDARIVDETLRSLKDRFAAAGEIAQLSSDDHSREEREALRQTRLFFKERTGAIARIREVFNQHFFTSPGGV